MARDSCLTRVTAGIAVGGAVGGAVGAVYGTYEAIRYKFITVRIPHMNYELVRCTVLAAHASCYTGFKVRAVELCVNICFRDGHLSTVSTSPNK
ncbi:hypothetical protein OROGR_025219 [Orobanche gracilis]